MEGQSDYGYDGPQRWCRSCCESMRKRTELDLYDEQGTASELDLYEEQSEASE